MATIRLIRKGAGRYETPDGRFRVASVLQAGCVRKIMAWVIDDNARGKWTTAPSLGHAREWIAARVELDRLAS